jgi:hypothetical protein
MKIPRRFLHGGGMHSVPKTFFDFPFSGNGYKIRLALTQLGLPFAFEVRLHCLGHALERTSNTKAH